MLGFSKQIQHKKEDQPWIFLLIFLLFLLLFASLSSILDFNDTMTHLSRQFLSYLCHEQESRAFYLGNEPMILCTRCTGIYFSLFLGLNFSLFATIQGLRRKFMLTLLGLSIFIIFADVMGNFFNIWENSNGSRFITGIFLGVSLSLFFINKKNITE